MHDKTVSAGLNCSYISGEEVSDSNSFFEGLCHQGWINSAATHFILYKVPASWCVYLSAKPWAPKISCCNLILGLKAESGLAT